MPRPRKVSQSIKTGRKARTGKAADVRITVRFDAAEARGLKRAASTEGKAVSELIRDRVL